MVSFLSYLLCLPQPRAQAATHLPGNLMKAILLRLVLMRLDNVHKHGCLFLRQGYECRLEVGVLRVLRVLEVLLVSVVGGYS